MDAWETLLLQSSLTPPGFDAWEHLNAQEGGGDGDVLVGGVTSVDISTILSTNITTMFSVNINSPVLTVELGEVMTININKDLKVEI